MHENNTLPVKAAEDAFEKNHSVIENAAAASNSLLVGKLGLVVYYFSLYEITGDEQHANKCVELVEEVINSEGDGPGALIGTSFANGTAGLGYVLTLLQRTGLVEMDLADEFSELDETIVAVAMEQIVKQERNDYLHGALGAIHYFTSRCPEPHIKQYLETLVNAFCDKAVIAGDGLWFRNFISDEKEKERIDTGLSHGNAGMLLILLNVLKAGILESRLKEVVRKGIDFLISQQSEPDKENGQYSFFPFYINSHDMTDKFFAARLAWCYGDLNIILLLYRAAEQLNEPAWITLADELSVDVVKRTDEKATMVSDSHFCHGASGLAQFYSTLFTITRKELFSAASEYWINQTVKLLDTELKENYYTGKETDLLNGLPGINLVLLSYINKKELAWGRLLLL